MAYPKPLSDKNIKELLAAWDTTTVDLILNHYKLCADMYGFINLEAAWAVAEIVHLPVKQEDFYLFSDVARRMALPFYVMNTAEIYRGIGRKARKSRVIVNAKLVTQGVGKYRMVRLLDFRQEEILASLSYFAEENLADIVTDTIHVDELKAYLDALQLPDGTLLCEDYRSMPPVDNLLKLGTNGALTGDTPHSTSEKLVNMMVLECHAGISEAFRHVQYYLHILGVEHRVEYMFEIMIDCFQKSRWWSLCGYTPAEVELLDDADDDSIFLEDKLEFPLDGDNAQNIIDLLEKIYAMPVKEMDMDMQVKQETEDDKVTEWQRKRRSRKYN